ncbi:MAG: PadR family transcriptional regulator [Bifidobacteriaceae bacterium]|jgi:DNA-binding PadR family transcriptional regulator|nr:PadR family transcriptional regulator [Bifidobacteriaceae bacterium]
MRIDKDLVAASATPLVLAILAESAQHGYAILKRVSELSCGRMAWTDGMLYPLLHRLEAAGHISSAWGVAASGRRRKVYTITESGRALLADRREQWAVVAAAMRAAGLSGPGSAAAAAAAGAAGAAATRAKPQDTGMGNRQRDPRPLGWPRAAGWAAPA